MKIIYLLIIFSKFAMASDDAILQFENKNNESNQGFCFVQNTKELLLLTLTKQKKIENSSVSYLIDSKLKFSFQDPDIGHQGITLEADNINQLIFWTSAKDAPDTAIRFDITKNGELISKKKFKVFDKNIFSKNDTMPTITPDKKFIFFRGRTSSRDMFIRKYNLSDLIKFKENIIPQIEYVEFNLSPSNLKYPDGTLRPLQAISADSEKLYVLYGDAKLNQKAIFIYTFNGDLIKIDDKVKVGLIDKKTNYYEPEGISYSAERNAIYVLFITKINSTKIGSIYKYN